MQSIITPLQNHTNNSYINNSWLYTMEQPLASIELENIDDSLITKWIANEILRTDLKYRLHLMQHIPLKNFHIYTDSLLDTSEFNVTGHVIIGTEWILKGSELSFECRIINSFYPQNLRF
jgi:hypothetical protein